jgi:hypothetical protein
VISAEIESSKNENGNIIKTKVEEAFRSTEWTIYCQKNFTEDDYIWSFTAVAQNDDGNLKIRVEAVPRYTQMVGGVADELIFTFEYKTKDDDTLRKVKLVFPSGSKTAETTYDLVTYDDIVSEKGGIKGHIQNNPDASKYIFDGKTLMIFETNEKTD